MIKIEVKGIKNMICCKIVADYKQQSLEFANIFGELNKIGDVLLDGRYFYFANTNRKTITEKNVRKIFKKYGCSDVFIEKYDQDLQPRESDFVNWWIEDKLIKIGYVEFEEEEQEKMQFISEQLTELNEMLEQLKEKQEKQKEK